MKKVETEPVLEGTLSELLIAPDEAGGSTTNARVAAIYQVLSSEPGGPSKEFRFPAADTGDDVFMKNPQLLLRFLSLTKDQQALLLSAVRDAMRADGVNTLRLEIPWARNHTKWVTVRKTDKILDIRF